MVDNYGGRGAALGIGHQFTVALVSCRYRGWTRYLPYHIRRDYKGGCQLTILITGASGLIGSHLCKKLAENGANVIALTHQTENPVLSSVPQGDIEIAKCDICGYDNLSLMFDYYQPDSVFHFAAHLPSTPNPDFIKVNVIGTTNLLDICYRKGVKNFVHASSMSVYSTPPVRLPVDEEHPTRPDDNYGRTKLIGELLCECYSRVIRTVVVRFSSMFGLGDNSRVAYHFMRSALSGQAIQVDGDGSQSSDFIYVDNAVQGVMLAMEKGRSGEVYNIGSGQETSVLELANLIARLVEPNVEVKLSGKPATRPFRFAADIGKARSELGHSPSSPVDGLRKYREEIMTNGTH